MFQDLSQYKRYISELDLESRQASQHIANQIRSYARFKKCGGTTHENAAEIQAPDLRAAADLREECKKLLELQYTTIEYLSDQSRRWKTLLLKGRQLIIEIASVHVFKNTVYQQ